MSLTPETRKENFLARIAGDPGKVLEPLDREEWFLQRIIDTGGEVTPGSVVDATAAMTPAQAAQTRQNIGADTPETVERSLLTFNATQKSLTSNGKIGSSTLTRMTTFNYIENVVSVIPGDGYEASLYAYDKNGNGLGFFNADYTLNKLSLSFSTNPIIISHIANSENIASIRPYIRKTSEEAMPNTLIDANRNYVTVKGTMYAQKIWYAIGDSITYGTYSYGSGSITREPDISYAKQCSLLLNYKLTNLGVPNLGFTVNATDSSFTDQSLVDVMTNHDFVGAELVTIALGTNDYGRNGVLGTLSDNSSTNSIYGRMKYIIETLATKCPRARIMFITPIPRETHGSISTQFDKYTDNDNGFDLNDVKEAIIEFCTFYGIEYIDATDNFAINYSNYQTYQKDHLHPTVQGHMLMAKAIAPKLI